jgi:hypothetical protein
VVGSNPDAVEQAVRPDFSSLVRGNAKKAPAGRAPRYPRESVAA